MEFTSFEEALEICIASPDGSPEQDAALLFCLEHAPPSLKQKMGEEFLRFKNRKNCGCGDHHHGPDCGHD